MSVFSAKNIRLGSVAENSALNVAYNDFTSASNCAALAEGTATIANASRGIALRRLPPSIEDTLTPKFSAEYRKRKSNFIEFDRPRTISIPEWPPFKPVTDSL